MTGDPRAGWPYVQEVAAALWPDADVRRRFWGRSHDRQWILLPTAARVRLVLPVVGLPGAASATAAAEGRGTLQAAALRGAALAIRSGLSRVAADRLVVAAHGPSLLDELLAELAPGPTALAWAVGPRRANRKPVLRVMSGAGTTIAFVKVGFNPLTRQLVRAERAALAELADARPAGLGFPTVLGARSTDDLELLAISVLDTSGSDVLDTSGSSPDEHATRTAMLGVAHIGSRPPTRVIDTAWWRSLPARVGALAEGPARDELAALLESAGPLESTLPFGSWHGDWNHGNFAVAGKRVTVWDWERFQQGVPLGFDAQHLALQSAITSLGRPPADAAAWAIETAPARLAPWGMSPHEATTVAALHLTELAIRYTEDGQREAGADLGEVEHWAIPAVRRVVARA